MLSNVVFHVRTRRLESEAQWQAIQDVLLSKLASDLPACSGEVINTALSLRLKETARADQQMAEKNDALQREYYSHGIKYYILQDEGQTKIIWANGTFECRVCGDFSEEEAIAIVDSIYKDG